MYVDVDNHSSDHLTGFVMAFIGSFLSMSVVSPLMYIPFKLECLFALEMSFKQYH